MCSSFLGTAPETLSRKLTEFEEAGYIKQKPHRKIEVLDLDQLLLLQLTGIISAGSRHFQGFAGLDHHPAQSQ